MTAAPARSPVREAATLVLLRDTERGLEVLMVKRGRGLAFMAGAHVFPGGRLDEADGGDFALAAAREAFEEAGVLIALHDDGQPAAVGGASWIEPARLAVARGEVKFPDVLREHGLRVDTSGFVRFARWVTPAHEPKRFDAHFFMARLPALQAASPDPGGEVVDFRWDRPRAFVDAQLAAELFLAPPTLNLLTELARFATVEEALAWGRARPFIAVRPKLLVNGGGELAIVLPWDPEYAALPDGPPGVTGESEPLSPESPVAGPVTRYVLRDGLFVSERRPRA